MFWHDLALQAFTGGLGPDTFGAAYINNLLTSSKSTFLDLEKDKKGADNCVIPVAFPAPPAKASRRIQF